MSGVLQPRRFGDENGSASSNGEVHYGDEAFARKYPVLQEFLAREYWEPGKPREKGSLIIFLEDGVFKACLSDKDSMSVAFVTKSTFTGLLEAVEKGLASGNLDWRLSSQGKTRKRR